MHAASGLAAVMDEQGYEWTGQWQDVRSAAFCWCESDEEEDEGSLPESVTPDVSVTSGGGGASTSLHGNNQSSRRDQQF